MDYEFGTTVETETTQDQPELNEGALDDVVGGITGGTKPKPAAVDYF